MKPFTHAAHDHLDTLAHDDAGSFLARTRSAVAGLLARARQASARRRLAQQLSEMSDSMLLDIGIAEDELHRIRRQEMFTPRAWAMRNGGTARF